MNSLSNKLNNTEHNHNENLKQETTCFQDISGEYLSPTASH